MYIYFVQNNYLCPWRNVSTNFDVSPKTFKSPEIQAFSSVDERNLGKKQVTET